MLMRSGHISRRITAHPGMSPPDNVNYRATFHGLQPDQSHKVSPPLEITKTNGRLPTNRELSRSSLRL